MTKIKLVVPIIQVSQTEKDERKTFFETKLSNQTELDTVSLSEGPASIDSHFDHQIAVPEILTQVKEAEKEGFDAVVIDCFMDPGVNSARELVNIPVMGPGKCAMHLATLLGHRMSILSPGDEKVIKKTPPRVQSLGFENRFASLRKIGLKVLELSKDPEATKSALLKSAEKAKSDDGADVIVMGCTGMARFARHLKSSLNIPVIEPATTALKMAEAVVGMEISHSKTAYPTPKKKERSGFEVLEYLR